MYYDVCMNYEVLAIKVTPEKWKHCGCRATFLDHYWSYKSRVQVSHTSQRKDWILTKLHSFWFKFRFTYRPWSKNTNTNTCSRIHKGSMKPQSDKTILPLTCTVAPVLWEIMADIAWAQNDKSTCPEYLHENSLFHKPFKTHLYNGSTHYSVPHTHNVTYFVQSCQVSAQSRTARQLATSHLELLPMLHCPWSHIAIDFFTDLPDHTPDKTPHCYGNCWDL